jgi:hypothetical protein
MTRTWILAALLATSAVAAQDVSSSERSRAAKYLSETEAQVLSATKGLSSAQLTFKPGPDRWSIAEVIEHLTIVEQWIQRGLFDQFTSAPAPDPKRDVAAIDSMLMTQMPDRTTKAKAPEFAQPTGKGSPAETIQKFTGARTATTQFSKSQSDLRGHIMQHPFFGPLDGYQWLIMIAAHTERHAKQIAEVKADPNFPAR